jgi:hypothetical protein
VGADALEQQLREDLTALEDRFADEEFCGDLYRALANNVWSRDNGPDGHVALSWGRAEELVNELRARVARDPLELAQTGGEGEVTPLVRDELAPLGWTIRPLNTSRHDPQHLAQPETPPAPGTEGMPGWERQAHAEADADHEPPATDQGAGG